MTIKLTPFRLAFSLRIRAATVLRFFISATAITAWVSGKRLQTLFMLPSALMQLAHVATPIVTLSMHHNHLQLPGTFALKFIQIIRQKLCMLAQIH